jgi:hypothetical protein
LEQSACRNKSNLPNVEAQQKRKGQTFKNKSNSLCQSRADLQLLKATPSTKKRNEKREPQLFFASNSGICLTKNFMKRKLPQHCFVRKMKFLFALPTTGRACCRAGIHCSSCPEPLLIKDIKVQVNKQKPNIVRPAQMKHNSDKMTIAPTSSQPCSKPNVACCATTLSLI